MKRTLLVVFLALLISVPALTFAGEGIVPCDGPDCQACDFVELGQKLISWFIGIMATIIALMFAFGGMKMVMSGGSTEAISQARTTMTNSVVGFVILLSGYLIVDTALKLLLNEGALLGPWNEIQCVPGIPSATSQSSQAPSVASVGKGGGLSQDDAVNRLTAANVSVTSSGGKVQADCSGTSGCTSLQGIRDATIKDAIDLKRDCNCDVTITGGTESTGGHAAGATSHGNGYKYDARMNPKLNTYIITNYKNSGVRSDGATMYTAPDGTIYAQEGDHWDVLVRS
ncbi:MAG: pilin [Candidatus Pacebacteria bacterium]|nr:pilin [Candidatus Paceibacterota bacterium]MCF7857274.1 pilin [Candidatus Paceibacterota bacterium]